AVPSAGSIDCAPKTGASTSRHGLFPLVAGARVAALAWRIAAPGTDARLAGAAAKAGLAADMADDLAAARAVLVEAILDQQIADIAEGRPPSNHVELRRLGRRGAHRLAKALRTVTTISDFVQRTLSNRRPEQAA
ncbi:MAG: putative nucleotidyltransferase substrate binding domain-containing protein, partial [Reyranella sp.]|nr:putative nucleotidyltransferase substrate binding domain-containing protein [Reyranella sp.]